MSDAKPYSKQTQLARGDRRYNRRVASPKRWQQIADAKQGPCRGCGAPAPNQLHHIVSRAHGGGDTQGNIIPLCEVCHELVTRRVVPKVVKVLSTLTDAEYAYAVQNGGEGFFERAYGLEFQR